MRTKDLERFGPVGTNGRKTVDDVLADFRPTGYGNEYLQLDGFAISYRGDSRLGFGFSGFDGDHGGCAETALIVDDKYHVLNGDFRREYAERYDSLAACLRFFLSKPECVSSWATGDAAEALQRALVTT